MTRSDIPDARPRLVSIDVLRLVALLAVVVGHVYDDNELVERAVQSWRLPVFFMLTGYFWSAGRSLGEEVRRRARALLVPYAVWVLLITGLVLVNAGGGWASELRRMSAGVLLGGSYAVRPWTTFWFVTTLFTSVVIYRLLTRAPVWVRLVLVLLGLLGTVLAGPSLALLPYAVGTAPAALVFIEAGRVVRAVQARVTAPQRAALAGCSLAVATVLVVTPRDFVALDIKYGIVPPVAVLAALLICTALLLAATAWRGPTGRAAEVVTALARPALVVILAHPVVLAALPPEEAPLPLPLIVALAFALPLVLGLVVVRTPVSPLLAGVPQVTPTRRRAAVASPDRDPSTTGSADGLRGPPSG